MSNTQDISAEELLENYGSREDWERDEENEFYTDEYNAFLRNDCTGILTLEQAIAAYKNYSGRDPDSVTEWPEIDWVQSKRNELLSEADSNAPKEALEKLANRLYPFEPMLKTSY